MSSRSRFGALCVALALGLPVGASPAIASPAAGAAPAVAVAPRAAVPAVSVAPAAGVQAATKKGTAVSLKANDRTPRKGEMVWFTGRVSRADLGLSGARVVLERRSSSSSKWKKVAQRTSSSSGAYSVKHRVGGSGHYRARVLTTPTFKASRSAVVVVRTTSAGRSLSSRAKVLKSQLGSAKSKVRTATVSGSKIAYRTFSKGMLVRTGSGKAQRTWVIQGDILAAYAKAGGPKGSYGVPVADARCGLLEGGCVQEFTRGTLYDSSTTRKASGVGRTGKLGAVLAAAKSQVGYTLTKGKNRSKYNDWKGLYTAWCGMYQQWAYAAAGHRGIVPQVGKFSSFASKVRSGMKTGAKPKVGALVFFDTIDDGKVNATHVGIVAKVNRSSITTYEGNTSNPKNRNQRGVYLKTRPLSMPLYYAYPDYS